MIISQFSSYRLKVAGELLPGVIHVASRSVSKNTGCLYCDYSDVFTTRGVGIDV